MAKYIYPAIFQPDNIGYFINFPDLEGCFTQGDDEADGLDMAQDVLSLYLVHMEDDKISIPPASPISGLKAPEGGFVTLVSCDTTVYRHLMNKTAVKKTLTIPSWLNESATAAGINFSQVLQKALMKELNISGF